MPGYLGDSYPQQDLGAPVPPRVSGDNVSVARAVDPAVRSSVKISGRESFTEIPHSKANFCSDILGEI